MILLLLLLLAAAGVCLLKFVEDLLKDLMFLCRLGWESI